MSFFAEFGQKIFNKRLYVGLAVALVGLEFLVPDPFLHGVHLRNQLLALVLIGLGLGLRTWGSGCAGSHTRSGTIEARRLVTGGPFAYVRNPIYLGSIVLGIGMSTLIGDPLAYALTALAFGLLYSGIIPAEEQHLAAAFGEEYRIYRQSVPRLIPRFPPWSGGEQAFFQWRAARGELFIASTLVAIYGALHFEEYLDRLFPWA